MKKSALIISAVVLLVIIGIVYFLYQNTGITITYSPQNSQATIDGEKISSSIKTQLSAGNHDVKILLEDYIPFEQEINLGFGTHENINVELRGLPIPEKIVSDQARFPSFSENKDSIFYLGDSGKTMYEVIGISLEETASEKISPSFFESVTNVVWSPNKKLAIVKQNEKNLLYDFSRYDLLHQEITELDEGIKNITFSPDSSKIVYYYSPSDSTERTLVEASKTNTDKYILYNFMGTGIENPRIDYSPDGKSILLVADNKMYLLDILTENLTQLAQDKIILEAKFTPTNNIIFTTNTSTFTTSKEAIEYKELDINTSLNKLTFFDDYTVLFIEDKDNYEAFYLYSLQTDQKVELVYNTKYKLDPISALLTTDQKYIYFESNRFLYRLPVDTNEY